MARSVFLSLSFFPFFSSPLFLTLSFLDGTPSILQYLQAGSGRTVSRAPPQSAAAGPRPRREGPLRSRGAQWPWAWDWCSCSPACCRQRQWCRSTVCALPDYLLSILPSATTCRGVCMSSVSL
jgi:hypothetical protein